MDLHRECIFLKPDSSNPALLFFISWVGTYKYLYYMENLIDIIYLFESGRTLCCPLRMREVESKAKSVMLPSLTLFKPIEHL